MVYERMGHTINPETLFTVRSADQANFTKAGRLLKVGEASYRPTVCGLPPPPPAPPGSPPVLCRWGDYEATSFDGAGGIWFAGEYANSHTDPNTAPWFGRNWGTWIGSVSSHDGG
jgi:hypothetical protein